MAASSSDYRPLLGAGLWLAALAAVLATWYGVAGDSFLSLALGLQLLLVAVACWAVRNLHRKRDLAAGGPQSLPDEAALRHSVQTQSIVLACTAAVVGLLALVPLLHQALGFEPRISGGTAFGAVCLASAFVWLVLALALQGIPPTDLPEAQPLAFAFRESQWAAFVAAAGVGGALFHPGMGLWAGRVLLVWVLAVCTETLLRLIAPLLVPLEPRKDVVAPIHLLLREAVFATGNPVGNMLRTLESRFGFGLRSTWAITFVKRAALPLLLLLLFLFWGATSLAIVEMGQLGVREHFGRVTGEPLPPGLHVKLPWPFGRIRTFAVKTVHQTPIGFVEAEEPAILKEPRALLWTKGHSREEFALVLGGGTELVVVNALLYFKIAEDRQGFLDYVYRQAAPEEALTAFAYRALMEETRGRTLEEVLTVDRAAFARRLAESVRRQSHEARLGLEIVDLALLNLHPPIEAAPSYLDVSNARLDARRRVTEADSRKQVDLLTAQTRGATAVATAGVEGHRRVAEALGEVAEFTAIGQASSTSPQTMRLRLWIEALEKALAGQRLFLVDPTLLSEGGELMLDTRRQSSTPLPAPEVIRITPPPGAKQP